MSYRLLKVLTVLLPTLIIGGFEIIRHEYLLSFSMEAGNWIITLLTLIISYVFSVWMFRTIKLKNHQLSEEKARGAVYEERERIAQELHDNIAQILFFLNVKMKQGEIDEARAAVSEIDHHLRQAIFNLRSSPEVGTSYANRIIEWVDEWSAMSGIGVSKDIQIPDKYFTLGEEVQLFAIIQEAFTNIRKHSDANRAQIVLQALSDRWSLEIIDDGIGIGIGIGVGDGEGVGSGTINPDEHRNKYGLSMMKKHANELRATLEIKTIANGGTELRIHQGVNANHDEISSVNR